MFKFCVECIEIMSMTDVERCQRCGSSDASHRSCPPEPPADQCAICGAKLPTENMTQATWWLGDTLDKVKEIQGEPLKIHFHNNGKVVEWAYVSCKGSTKLSFVVFVASENGLSVYKFKNQGGLHASFPLILPDGNYQDVQPGGWWIGSSREDVARLEGVSPLAAFIEDYPDQEFYQEVWQYPGEAYPGNRSSVRFDRQGLVVGFSNSANQLKMLRHPNLQQLKYGDTYEKVIAIQGPPVEIRGSGNKQTWYYAADSFDRCTTIEFENGVVVQFRNSNGLLLVRF